MQSIINYNNTKRYKIDLLGLEKKGKREIKNPRKFNNKI
jgi:hypothetical protein